MLSKMKDYPFLGTMLLAVGVILHRIVYDWFSLFPDVADSMTRFDQAWSIYIGFGAVVAIAAGFTGVVVVFALSSESGPLRTLRLGGGDRLAANWVSPVAAALCAAFGSFVCAVLVVADQATIAWWLFEFFFLLAAGSSLRLVWLFRALIAIVRAHDEHLAKISTPPVSLASLPRHDDRRQSGA